MKATTETTLQITVAARVSGEDLKQGDFVAVLSEVCQLPSYLWGCSNVTLPADELIHLRYLPREAGEPFKVLGVCLPFVYVKPAKGKPWALDTRLQKLVRLDEQVARRVWKRLRKKKNEAKAKAE